MSPTEAKTGVLNVCVCVCIHTYIYIRHSERRKVCEEGERRRARTVEEERVWEEKE